MDRWLHSTLSISTHHLAPTIHLSIQRSHIMMKSLLRYYILRCLWTLLVTIHVCRADLRSSYSKLHYGQKLERRMITSYDKYSILDCVEDCLRTTRCRSINYYQGAHFCQTNFENRTTVPKLYIEKPGWIYTDIEDWDKEIAGACSRSSCNITEKCIPKPFDDFDCVLSDCGIPEGPGYSLDQVEEWDGIGITRGIHVTCSPWNMYTQHGSGFFLCRSDGTWRKDLSCILKHSCKDIYASNPSSSNGIYKIQNRENKPFKVYCEFHDNFGYTYVSRNAGVEINIDDLLTSNEHIKVRHVLRNGTQIETVLENIELYKDLSLGIFYNRQTDYARPKYYSILAPYLYVGFLPISKARYKSIQGYRAANKDFNFTNCDANPNSYFVFYFNPKEIKKYENESVPTDFMRNWITVGTTIPKGDIMPPEFYFDYEIHMGGCGGFVFRHQRDKEDGAALGLRFDQ